MKILITEDKRFKIAINWLDEYYGKLRWDDRTDENGNQYWDYIKDGKTIFTLLDNDTVWVDKEIMRFLTGVFGLNYEIARTVILVWLRKTNGIDVKDKDIW